MKNRIIIIAAAFATAACGLSETGLSQRPAGGDIWKNPSYSTDSTDTDRRRCYITGLDYPDGYDWRADSENGTVKCSLVVFADGRPVMKVPVGHEYHVSPDPDMHRIINGHLYTDYSTQDETVIKKDGQEIFRYDGREMILAMAISEGEVFTLGQPRYGSGFTYRRNGEIVMERSSGRVFPRLQNDGDTLCFAFSEPVETAKGDIERYYHTRNGKVTQTAVRDDVKKVWDVILHEGNVCYLATMTGIPAPVIVNGERMKALELDEGIGLLTSWLFPAGRSLAAEAICSSGTGYYSTIWIDAGKYRQFPDGMTVNGICSSGEGICCVLNPSAPGRCGQIFRCGESFDMPYGYVSMGNNAIAMMDGILHVGLSSSTGGKPILWKDGKTEKLDINGMICTVTVE